MHKRCCRFVYSPRSISSLTLSVFFLAFVAVLGFEIYYTTKVSFRLDILNNWQKQEKEILVQRLNQYNGSPSQAAQRWNHSTSNSLCNKCTNCSRRNEPAAAHVQSLSSLFVTNYTSETFTVIVPTYKRNYCIYTTLRHYCNCKSVAKIIVLWNNVDEEIPRYLKKLKCKVELIFKKMNQNRMTTRYIPFPEIQTEGKESVHNDWHAF